MRSQIQLKCWLQTSIGSSGKVGSHRRVVGRGGGTGGVSPHKADTVGENKEVRLHEMRGVAFTFTFYYV
jgi:rhamnose utilization protein RhaD (predicted bifunctional aldolase and dehydrogenase)